MATENQPSDLDRDLAELAHKAATLATAGATVTETAGTVARAEGLWSKLPGTLGLTAEEWREAGEEAARERATQEAGEIAEALGLTEVQWREATAADGIPQSDA